MHTFTEYTRGSHPKVYLYHRRHSKQLPSPLEKCPCRGRDWSVGGMVISQPISHPNRLNVDCTLFLHLSRPLRCMRASRQRKALCFVFWIQPYSTVPSPVSSMVPPQSSHLLWSHVWKLSGNVCWCPWRTALWSKPKQNTNLLSLRFPVLKSVGKT